MNWRAVFLCLAVGFCGCKKDKNRDFLFGGAIEPPVQGQWTGAMTINSDSANITLNITQNNIAVAGTYESAGPTTMGTRGQVTGVTTGPTVALTLTPDDAACSMTAKLGGQNSGARLSLTLSGTDCGGQTMRGQTTLNKI